MTKRTKPPIDLKLTLFATWSDSRPEFLDLAPNADWAAGYVAGFERAAQLGLDNDAFDINATVETGDLALEAERDRAAG